MESLLHVLIVDDDEVDRSAVRRALKASGLSAVAVECRDVEEALRQFDERAFDCVITDLEMPRAGGRELIEEVRRRGSSVPIIVLTGRGDEHIAVEMMKAGAVDYLPKGSLTPALVAQSLRGALRIQRVEREKDEAQRALARHVERLTRLQVVSQAFAAARTPAEVAEVVLQQGVAALGGRGGVVALLSIEGDWLEMTSRVGYPAGGEPDARRVPMKSRQPLTDAVRSKLTLLHESPEKLREAYPGLDVHPDDLAMVSVPLTVDGKVLGVLSLAFAERRTLSEDDSRFLEALARQYAEALERSRLDEAERVARAEAETANRAKDAFLSMLSHELRTPLTAILGWTQMLRTGDLREDERDGALAIIENNAKSQAKLIEELLDVSRIVSGKLVIERDPILFQGVVRAALDAARPAVEKKKLRLRADLGEGLAKVEGDAGRLRQVVSNLLANAIKFTPKGGEIFVDLTEQATEVTLVVRDTGIGISGSFLPHVFERFQQAATALTECGGLGLGLALVSYLIAAHKGTIEASSPGLGGGATFTVVLPVLAEAST